MLWAPLAARYAFARRVNFTSPPPLVSTLRLFLNDNDTLLNLSAFSLSYEQTLRFAIEVSCHFFAFFLLVDDGPIFWLVDLSEILLVNGFPLSLNGSQSHDLVLWGLLSKSPQLCFFLSLVLAVGGTKRLVLNQDIVRIGWFMFHPDQTLRLLALVFLHDVGTRIYFIRGSLMVWLSILAESLPHLALRRSSLSENWNDSLTWSFAAWVFRFSGGICCFYKHFSTSSNRSTVPHVATEAHLRFAYKSARSFKLILVSRIYCTLVAAAHLNTHTSRTLDIKELTNLLTF